jgi:hypothetical protein
MSELASVFGVVSSEKSRGLRTGSFEIASLRVIELGESPFEESFRPSSESPGRTSSWIPEAAGDEAVIEPRVKSLVLSIG